MPSTRFAPLSLLFTNTERLSPPNRLRAVLARARTFMRKPLVPAPYEPEFRSRQSAILAKGRVGPQHMASIFRIGRAGPSPTIVIGGFVPDATESVFLISDLLLKHGSVYCVNYPRQGFDMDLLFAQLDDLVDEINTLNDRMPVIFSISFGSGIVMEWLRRRRILGGMHAIKGLVMVSPVTCVEDLLDPAKQKPDTLLGRAIKPYLAPEDAVDTRQVEKSRSIFARMFESGAQNTGALAALMSESEVRTLRDRVMGTISSVDFRGACERVRALKAMLSPRSYFTPEILPLSEVPTLILYAEKEESVVTDTSPARFVFEKAHGAYFSRSRCVLIRNRNGSPVQHASLIFHHANFRPSLGAFYKSLNPSWLRRAA